MAPEGPERSDNCRPVDVFAPPPLPVQVINITSIDTVNVARVGEDSQDVTVSARSASQYIIDSLPNRPTYSSLMPTKPIRVALLHTLIHSLFKLDTIATMSNAVCSGRYLNCSSQVTSSGMRYTWAGEHYNQMKKERTQILTPMM